jgi:hypothetical protein
VLLPIDRIINASAAIEKSAERPLAMKPLCLLLIGAIAPWVVTPSLVYGQVDNSFQPAGVADWNVDSNWSDGVLSFVPSSQFDERAVINGGGTAFVAVNVPSTPGAILLGQTGLGSGHVEIRNGGTLGVNLVMPSALQDGSVTVGGTGTGSLTVLPGGTLNAAGTLVSGGNPVNTITIGGTSGAAANVTVGSATFNGTTRVFPNAMFTSNNTITFGGTSNYTAEISGANSAKLNATNSATLGGTLHASFAGTPALGSSWPLLEAAGVGGSFSNLTTNAALASGQNLYLSTTALGGGRERLDLNLQEVLVLQVNRDSGTATIRQPGGSTISVDGYSVLSSQGSLLTDGWNSLASQGALGGGWTQSNPSNANLSELKAQGAGSLSTGQSVSIGSVYDPLAVPFGFTGDDLSFEYTTPGGAIVPGLVEFSGTLVNNVILQVDPSTGKARMRNLSNTAVDIDAYLIRSSSASLTASTWSSFDERNDAGGAWLELLNISNSQVGEVNELEATLLGPGGVATLELGDLFNTSGTRDLEFLYLQAGDLFGSTGTVIYEAISADLDGDFNLDGAVDGSDFLAWQRGRGITSGATRADGDANSDTAVTAADLAIWGGQFGVGNSVAAATSSVPEPSSAILAGLLTSITGLAVRSRKTGRKPIDTK